MLLLIFFAAMIGLGVLILFFIFLIDKILGGGTWLYYNAEDILGIGLCFIGVFVICLVFSGAIAGVTQGFKDKDYQEALLEKQMLEYRLQEKDENLITSNQLYEDIVKFNKKLLDHKTHCNNLWLNLFHNDKIATIDYIELNLKE